MCFSLETQPHGALPKWDKRRSFWERKVFLLIPGSVFLSSGFQITGMARMRCQNDVKNLSRVESPGIKAFQFVRVVRIANSMGWRGS